MHLCKSALLPSHLYTAMGKRIDGAQPRILSDQTATRMMYEWINDDWNGSEQADDDAHETLIKIWCDFKPESRQISPCACAPD